MSLPLRATLNAALDELEAAIEAVKQTSLEPTPAQVAAGLDAEDFGGSWQAKVGLNYLKGEIEVLQDERDEARKRVTELREANATLSRQLGSKDWEISRLVKERDALIAAKGEDDE